MTTVDIDLGGYQLGWADVEDYVFKPKKGLNEEIIREMSLMKGEPEWMLEFRLKAYKRFLRKPIPDWGGGGTLNEIDFDDIYYYIKPMEGQAKDWDMVPESIKNTYEKLGIPEAERKYLAGVTAQYECLRGSTLVWSDRGMRPIKELEAGDTVFSLDETTKEIVPARVRATRTSGVKPIYEIKARGRVIGASGNHPFLSLRDARRPGRQRARYQAQWTNAEDLRVGDLIAVATDLPEAGSPAELLRATHPDGVNYPEITSDDLCWFIGLYLGDGYVHHRGRYESVEVAVDRRDEQLISEIVRVVGDLFGIEMRMASDGLRLVGRRTAALAEFLALNGCGGDARSKRFPEWAFGLPRSQRLAMLAGYVDADGYVRASATAKNVVLTSANESLLGDARELAQLSGIGVGEVRGFDSRHPFDADRLIHAHRLHLSGGFDQLPCRSPRRMERLGRRVYSHRYRTAKGTDFRTHTSDMLGYVRVESIEVIDAEPVWDIEVEGHRNFVAEGFVVHNSEVVYHRNRDDLAQLGVLFTDMDTALREYPEIVKEYFGTIIPPNDNKFAALNSAVWSGGSFIYVPPGVHVDQPLQAYFRINAENMGQFERTLIIVDEGAYVHYVEGCSAPVYTTDSLHSAVVEIVVKEGGRCRYTTIQNWSNNVFNLVTKRAAAYRNATMEWIDGNIGSRLTMKYPAVWLMEEGAHGEVLSIAYAGKGMHQDAGAKMVHVAPNTTSLITSKSICKDGGRAGYRGLVRVEPGAEHSRSFVRCDALILDEDSRSDTYPYMEIEESDIQIGHEATVSKVGDDQLFYLMSRGLTEEQATAMVVAGFIEPIVRELPMEYAVELNRLIELQMEGAVG